ncbi:tetraspanin-18-like [Vanacampus margaritifer]
MVGDSLHCIKYLMLVFNCSFVVTGLIFLAVGFLVAFGDTDSGNLMKSIMPLKVILYCVFLGGALLFFVGTVGCLGTVRENRCMIIIFFVFITILFIIQLSVGIWAYTQFELSNEDFKRDYENSAYPAYKVMWKEVMNTYRCCAMETAPKKDLAKIHVLKICCDVIYPLTNGGASVDNTNCLDEENEKVTHDGCFKVLFNLRQYYVYGGAALLILVMIFQLLAMSVSICLFRGLRAG